MEFSIAQFFPPFPFFGPAHRRPAFAIVGGCPVLAACLFRLPAYAATTGRITIDGVVPILCSLEVRQDPGAKGIADLPAGHAGRRIATVTETCNRLEGYTVTIAAGDLSYPAEDFQSFQPMLGGPKLEPSVCSSAWNTR